MIRLPSSFALAAWAGFHAVTAATQSAAALGRLEVLGVPIEGPAAQGAEQGLLIALSVTAATLCAVALKRIHRPDAAEVRSGEALGFVGIGISTAFVLAALFFGAPLDAVVSRIDLALWAVGLTLVALAFDSCLFAPDDLDDEREYQRALRMLEVSIPRRPRVDDPDASHEEAR